jgi:hypothetical protein
MDTKVYIDKDRVMCSHPTFLEDGHFMSVHSLELYNEEAGVEKIVDTINYIFLSYDERRKYGIKE